MLITRSNANRLSRVFHCSDPTWKEAFISPRSAHGTIVQLAESNLDDAGEREAWAWERLASAIFGEDA
jgi:hypothetical protein